MTDQAYTRGDTFVLEDDFEWVNAWAASPRQRATTAPPAASGPSLPRPQDVGGFAAKKHESAEHADRTLVAIADDPPLVASVPLTESAQPSPAASLAGTDPGASAPGASAPNAPAIQAMPPGMPAAPQDSLAASADLPSSVSPSLSADSEEPADPVPAADGGESDAASVAVQEPPSATAAIPLFETARRMGRKRWTNLFRMVTRDSEAEADPASESPAAAAVAPAVAAEPCDETQFMQEMDAEPAIAPDQLERDIAEIEFVRDRLLAESAAASRRMMSAARFAPVRTSDYVPILVGGVLAFTSLVVFGAAASLVSLR